MDGWNTSKSSDELELSDCQYSSCPETCLEHAELRAQSAIELLGRRLNESTRTAGRGEQREEGEEVEEGGVEPDSCVNNFEHQLSRIYWKEGTGLLKLIYSLEPQRYEPRTVYK